MDINIGTVSGLIAGGATLCGLAAFLVKALIHKTNAPLSERVKQLENSMLLSEESQKTIKTIMELVQDIPNKIDEKIKSREEDREQIYNLKFATKEELASKWKPPC